MRAIIPSSESTDINDNTQDSKDTNWFFCYTTIIKILFVCRANVGRSQMAEVVFNTLSKGSHKVMSAGTSVSNGKDSSEDGKRIQYGTLSSPIMESLAEINIRLKEATANQLTQKMIEEADIIISMAELENEPDYLRQSNKYEHWDVADPKKLSLEETNIIRDDIVNRVNSLIARID